MNTAIILAAGDSNRYKDSIPKQFCLFNKKMILEYSVNTFKQSDNTMQQNIKCQEEGNNHHSALI